MIDDGVVPEAYVIRMNGILLGGGLSEDDIKQAFANLENQLQALHGALASEQNKTAELERKLTNSPGGDGGSQGLIGAILKSANDANFAQ